MAIQIFFTPLDRNFWELFSSKPDKRGGKVFTWRNWNEDVEGILDIWGHDLFDITFGL